MPRTKKLADNLAPNVVQPNTTPTLVTLTQTPASDDTNHMRGEINDATVYEWGILVKDTATMAVDSAPFTPTKIGNWHGGSLSWVGNLFRRSNRKAIKTFADFQAQNPLDLPTTKTFFFFEITTDKDGIRKRKLVHEGTFSDPRSRYQKPLASTQNYSNNTLSDGRLIRPAGPNEVHAAPASYEAKSLREALERTITDLQRELDVTRRERDMYREQNEKLRSENEANREKIITIDGAKIRYEVEKEALERKYQDVVERMTQDHEREIDQLEQDHVKQLADARQNAERHAIQALNDGQSGYDKLMDSLSRFVDKASDPRYAGMIDMVSKLATQFIPGMGGSSAQGQLPMAGAMGQNPHPGGSAHYTPTPYGQSVQMADNGQATGDYHTAEAIHG